MVNHRYAWTFVLMKQTSAILLLVLWNLFKGLLTAGLVLMAGFAAWGAWLQHALGLAALAVVAVLFFLAVAPWLIPSVYLRLKSDRASAPLGAPECAGDCAAHQQR